MSAPAKINLGLAILGKRADGYHNIDTIMAMIDLADTITLHQVATPGISICGMDDVPVESNLITKAIRGWCQRSGLPESWQVDVHKCIPSPAGLGGGSSDAAAVIRALEALHPGSLSSDEKHKLAASLGADCPFFLGTACARATGVGTDLEPLRPPAGWVVIVVLPVDMDAKTAALYGALRAEDYGTRMHIDEVAAAIANPESHRLPNSFTRAAIESFPTLPNAIEALSTVAGHWSLSGAGPAVFAISTQEEEASRWQAALVEVLPSGFAVTKAEFLRIAPEPEIVP